MRSLGWLLLVAGCYAAVGAWLALGANAVAARR